ncbi:MAG: hypothetical protein ACE5GO_04010 [Anaerolineales bacterium]
MTHDENAAQPPPDSPEPIPPAPPKIAPRWPVLIPALIVILVYLPALRYGFVWDDTIFLRDLPIYRDPGLWFQSLFQPFALSPNYFRPLALLTFVAELRVGGLNPSLFHLTNILLHALNTALVAILAHRIWRAAENQKHALLPAGVGLLYGLHPALIEGVAFISIDFKKKILTQIGSISQIEPI